MSDRELKLKVHFEALDKLTGPLKGMFDGAGKASAKMRELSKIAKEQRGEIRALNDSMGNMGPMTREWMAANQKLENQLKQTNLQIDKQRKMVERANKAKAVGGQSMALGAGMTGAGVVMSAPLVASAQAAMELESAMADVRKVSDFNDTGFKELTAQIQTLSTQVPLTAIELAQITAQGAQDNIGGDLLARGDVAGAQKALIDFARDTSQMSVAFGITADAAADNMSAWRAGLHLTQDGVRELSNQINSLENTTTGGTAAGISEIVTRVGALGGVAGMAGKDVAAIASMMDGLKIPSEVGATGIQNMALALTQGTAATKSQKAAFDQIGLSAEDVAKRMQMDAQGTILDVFTRISKLDAAARPAALTQMFGRESIKAIAPMLGSLDLLKDKFDFVNNGANATNSMLNEFERRNKTTANSVKLLQNNMFNAKVTIGEQLSPAISALANLLSRVTTRFNEWAQKHPRIAQFLVIFIAAIAGLLLIIGPLLIGIGAIAFAMGALGITSLAAAAPFLLIGLAIAAIIAIGIILWQNWSKLPGWAKTIFTSIGTTIKAAVWDLPVFFIKLAWNIMKGLAGGITAGVKWVSDAIGKVVDKIKGVPKAELQIKSPSRLFAQYGEFINIGMANGLQKTMERPIAMAGRIAASVAAAGALSTGAMAGTPQNGAYGASHGVSIGNITIQINQLPGQSSQDLAIMVRQEIEKLSRNAESRSRSTYKDIGE
jgi:TP901 family phage tail tape measure protein